MMPIPEAPLPFSRIIRKRLRVTDSLLSHFAKRAGLARSTLTNLDRGKIEDMHLLSSAALAEAMEMPFGVFLEDLGFDLGRPPDDWKELQRVWALLPENKRGPALRFLKDLADPDV